MNALDEHGAGIALLSAQVKPLFDEHSVGVQAAVITDLMARVMASLDPNDRASALRGHLQLMHRLIPLYIPAGRRRQEELS